MQFTTVPQKFFASALNAMTVLIITSPLLLLLGFTWEWKLTTIIIFFLYEIILLATKDKRDFGMVLVKSYWREPFTIFQYIIFLYHIPRRHTHPKPTFHPASIGDFYKIHFARLFKWNGHHPIIFNVVV
jgi:hypothetical protein